MAATSALALRLLGPPAEAIRSVALFGSGYQAEAQLAGLLAVCQPEAVRVFSPRPQRRRAFVARLSPSTAAAGVQLEEASSPEAAVTDAQLVVCATNAMAPVVRPDWLRPGMHVSCIKKQEISAESLQRCDRVVVATPSNTRTVLAGVTEERVRGEAAGRSWWTQQPFHWDSLPDLAELLGDPAGTGRQRPDEITAYVGLGSGVQFAAACAMVHEAAVRDGVGRALPDEWFLQDVAQE